MYHVAGRDGIIRPVLCLKKEEILKYLEENQVPYETDSTNLSDDYTRTITPSQGFFPFWKNEINRGSIRHMAESAQLAAQAEEYLSRQGALLVEKYGQKRENGMLLSEEFWQKEPVVSSYGVLGGVWSSWPEKGILQPFI